jgi:hypothetical protein
MAIIKKTKIKCVGKAVYEKVVLNTVRRNSNSIVTMERSMEVPQKKS